MGDTGLLATTKICSYHSSESCVVLMPSTSGLITWYLPRNMGDIGEIAKAVKPLVDNLARLTGPMSEELGLLFGDKVRAYRHSNLTTIVDAAVKGLEGTGKPVDPVPPRLLLPILDAASLEANPPLQAMWSGLLASASQEKDSMSPSFIETLKQLTPDEARLLQRWWTDQIRPALEKERRDAVEMDSKLLDMRRRKDLPDPRESLMSGVRGRVVWKIQQRDFGVHSDTFERLGLIRRDFGVQVETTRGDDDEITDVKSEIGSRFIYTEYAVSFLEACHGTESKN